MVVLGWVVREREGSQFIMSIRMLGISSWGVDLIKRTRRPAYLSLLGAVAAVAVASSAHAGLVVFPDSPIGEVGVFGINAAGSTVTYSPTTHDLTISINTYFAGAPGAGGGGSPSYGTGYGSLFLSPNGYSAATNPYNYAVTTPYGNSGAPVSTNSLSPTATGLYAVGTYSALPSNVQGQTFTTSLGTLVGSNVNGADGGPSNYSWGNGIVQYIPGSSEAQTLSASVYVTPDSGPTSPDFPLGNVEGSITYTILNADSLFGNGSIGLYWAMTCGNESVSGTILPTPLGRGGEGSSTPLPAALPLFVTGLGMMGFFGSRRKRRMAQAPAA
jgi:hypothetical protein